MESRTREDIAAVRESAGLWLRDDHTFIRLTGRDVAPWLQSQSTNDVDALESGDGHANALLDRQGRLQAHFTLHRWEDEFWLIVEKQQAAHLLAQLDAHLFIEDVSIEETGGELDQLVLQGPNTLPLLAACLDTDEFETTALLPRTLHGCHPAELFGIEALAFHASPSGEDGYVFIVESGQGRTLADRIAAGAGDFPLREITPDAVEILRIEAGIPRLNVDIDNRNVIPETTLERTCVSYEKGCYLGQEVVARLRAYGSAKRALMGLVLNRDAPIPQFDAPILVDGKKAGQIKSGTFSPTLDANIVLAFLDRDHRVPGSTLKFSAADSACEATVVILPFHESASRAERAHALYDEALTVFESDLHDEDESAIPLLKKAILLDPAFEDAYEVLGVILHRHHRIDEAIHYMTLLETLDPDSIMVHTNLSVFYLAKGLIEEAEEEKAKAAVLEIKEATDARHAKELAESERERIRHEARERIAMFNEVLDIDPDDPVATFGLGKAHVQLNEYENAVPHLRRATEIQKDYSAAYLDLGKCYEFLDRAEEALNAYQQGIAVASRKGDLMPMREMERRMKALESAPTRPV